MNKFATIALVLAANTALGACSSGDSIVFDTRLGPETKSQIKSLPEGLIGDKTNAKRTSYTLEGTGMKDPDGK